MTSIKLSHINLCYAASAFRETSLKTLLTSAFNPRRVRERAVDIHALRDVSLEIIAGERVGLLGQNGAGKTTFLKMVAGLYPIASGSRSVDGAVRSLFDLSLGFEPDATGRENILYRGLLLGLAPTFMRAREQEIADFADLGKFIDYPIKTYSAGMQVRLAFAISTAVGGDILLLDEVIGAGDAAFMVKARQRIMQLVNDAQIVVLASHDFASLKAICTRGIVFHHGRVEFDGGIECAVAACQRMNGIIA